MSINEIETTSARSYIAVLLKMFADPSEKRIDSRDEILKKLIPYAILFNSLGYPKIFSPITTTWIPKQRRGM
jgi:hypothetical protein